MAGKKEFLVGLGERVGEAEDPDVLLREKLSDKRKAEIARQEEVADLEHQAKVAELKKKTVTATAGAEKAERTTEAPVSPFQVKGSINVGEFDFQKDREDAQRRAQEAESAMAGQIEAQRQENLQLREQLGDAKIESVKTTLMTQLNMQNQQLTQLINSQASRGSIADQIKAMKATAAELGLVDGGAGGSAAVQVELKRLEFELEDRKHAHDIEIRRLDDERDYKKQLIQVEREKITAETAKAEQSRNTLSQFPVILGQVIGQYMAKGAAGGGAVAGAVNAAAEVVGNVDAPSGASGEFNCPKCNGITGFGPSQPAAVCPGCGSRVSIQRSAARPPAPQVAEEEG